MNDQEGLRQILATLERAIRGDLDTRVLRLHHAGSGCSREVREVADALNYFLDKVEIFGVETRESLRRHAAGEERRIDERGFHQEFLANARMVNHSLEASLEQHRILALREKEAKDQADAAAQLASMIQGASTYFMTCDINFNISSVNPSLLAMLEKYGPQLRRRWPQFDPRRVIGTSIDQFHKTPDHQRRLLNSGALPMVAEVQVEGLEFSITVTELLDSTGKRIGFGAEWRDENGRALYRKEVARMLEECRQGHLSVRGQAEAVTPEFRPMVKDINDIVGALTGPFAEIRSTIAALGARDLTRPVKGQYAGDYAQLQEQINNALRGLNQILGEVTFTTDEIARVSDQVNSGSQAMSQCATEQAASLEEISASVNELSSQTEANAKGAVEASRHSGEVNAAAERGRALMEELLKAMKGIEESSTQISRIIRVIDEIAFQTNLLALNAAVEAARAGVHGKGFAVVAEEVRNLAARSANAAKETTSLIEGSVKSVQHGSQTVNRTASALQEIVKSSGLSASLVKAIADASSQQALALSQINTGVNQLDQTTQQNAATSEESAALALRLTERTSSLRQLLAEFKLAAAEQQMGLNQISPAQLASLPPQQLLLLARQLGLIR